jgi:hypothetical protein
MLTFLLKTIFKSNWSLHYKTFGALMEQHVFESLYNIEGATKKVNKFNIPVFIALGVKWEKNSKKLSQINYPARPNLKKTF